MSEKWISDEELERILRESSSKGNDDVEVEMEAPEEERYEEPAPTMEVSKINLEEFVGSERNSLPEPDFSILYDVPIDVRVVLGSVVMDIEKVLALEVDSVVKLSKLAGEPVEIMIGDQVIAKGEAVIIDDQFGVLITDIIPPRERVRTVDRKLLR